MKLPIKVLSALAVVTGFFVASSHAQATTINCTAVTKTGVPAYPYDGSVLKCGTTPTSEANGAAGSIYALGVLGPDAYTQLAAESAIFYIFADQTEYDTYFTERGLPHPAPGNNPGDFPLDAHGITWYPASPGNVPLWSAIVLENGNGIDIDTYAGVAWFTVHEAGHWLDYSYSTLVSSGDNYASNSFMFQDLLDKDWQNFNALTSCGIGGVFNGRKDFVGNYICSGAGHNSLPMTGIYNGATNKQVLQLGFGDRFTQRMEIFANEVARETGYSDDAPMGVAHYLNSGRFSCTMFLIQKLVDTGSLPTAAQMSAVLKPGPANAGCPTSGTGWSLP